MAREANSRGDEKTLEAIIDKLDVLYGNDHIAAMRFYTELEQTAYHGTRRQADRIDGYDRDDLGESPDF